MGWCGMFRGVAISKTVHSDIPCVCVLACVRLISGDISDTDYCVQLTLTCLHRVCHEWAVIKRSSSSQPGNDDTFCCVFIH